QDIVVDVSCGTLMLNTFGVDKDFRTQLFIDFLGNRGATYSQLGGVSLLAQRNWWQIQWDEHSSILRPDRVSPWEIEPLGEASPSNPQPPQRNKRARPPVLPLPNQDLSPLGLWKSQHVNSPSAFSYCDPLRGRDLYVSPNFSSGTKASSFSYSENNSLPPISSKSTYWSNQLGTMAESFAPLANIEATEKRQANRCRLFGIELLDHSTIEETSAVVVSRAEVEDHPAPSMDTESDQHSEPSNINRSDIPSSCEPERSCLQSTHESQSRQIRSCTKVHMEGTAVWRAVDLTRLDGYEDLLIKLEEVFDIKGELCGSSKKWQVVYTDDEDDIMMVGDDPWHEFCNMVRKIFIYTAEEVKKLSRKTKLHVDDEG
ncbi:unnamed protein product, partial [Ilex paraguariensis]